MDRKSKLKISSVFATEVVIKKIKISRVMLRYAISLRLVIITCYVEDLVVEEAMS